MRWASISRCRSLPDRGEKIEFGTGEDHESRTSNAPWTSYLPTSSAIGGGSARSPAPTGAFNPELRLTCAVFSELAGSFADPGYGIRSARADTAAINTTPQNNKGSLIFI